MADDRLARLLDILRSRVHTRWIADQVTETLAEGVLQKRSEPSIEAAFGTSDDSFTRTERAKRQTYQATRPYTAQEREALLMEVLRGILVELPAIQRAAVAQLQELGSKATQIVFLRSDESDDADSDLQPHDIDLSASQARVVEAEGHLDKIIQAISDESS